MDALLFFPLAVMIALTPGPNNFCALNNGIRQGVGAALFGTIGRVLAFAIFLTISAVGLGAMLLASETAFSVLKWLGAAYLFWLGWKAWHSQDAGHLAADDSQVPPRPCAAWPRRNSCWASATPRPCCCSRPSFRSSSTRPSRRPTSSWCWAPLISRPSSCPPRSMAQAAASCAASSPRRAARRRLNKATGGFFAGAGGLLLAAHR
jgi:threonine/homoserine/homoserine lactone efflux protein